MHATFMQPPMQPSAYSTLSSVSLCLMFVQSTLLLKYIQKNSLKRAEAPSLFLQQMSRIFVHPPTPMRPSCNPMRRLMSLTLRLACKVHCARPSQWTCPGKKTRPNMCMRYVRQSVQGMHQNLCNFSKRGNGSRVRVVMPGFLPVREVEMVR